MPSLSPVRAGPAADKQGQPCVAVDCIINSDVMKAVQQNRPLKAFVNELCVDYVGQKHKMQLDQKYKLPKMSYKGTEVRCGGDWRPQHILISPCLFKRLQTFCCHCQYRVLKTLTFSGPLAMAACGEGAADNKAL